MAPWLIAVTVIGGLLVAVALYDVVQRKHTILHNFPVLGHLRYLLESIGPELRQYIVTSNDEERPFNRAQRRWVYASSKRQNPHFGFGTDQDLDRAGYLIIKHAAFGHPGEVDENATMPCAKVLGGWRERPQRFRPASVVNISGMSYGSLSGPAVQAMNEGAGLAGCLHNTGEGGISPFHRHGADLIYQFGSGYFGCRNPDGTFSIDRMLETIGTAPVRAIEVKLSQGAKPGLGGLLPGVKVTPDIAAARGVPVGRTVASPSTHSAFGNVDGLIDFVESLAGRSGLPVGIKSAVGSGAFWNELARRMAERSEGPDFVTVDGGEGGTGAGPLVFTNHVALPFRRGFARVYLTFVAQELHQKVVFVGSGKLGFGAEALAAMNLGADLVNVGREAMLAIGCVQAQRCHTGHCPTGITTHGRWRTHGLDPAHKGVRCANYIVSLRAELLKLAHACGVAHPALVPADSLELLYEEPRKRVDLCQHYLYPRDLSRLSPTDGEAVSLLCADPTADRETPIATT